MTSMPSNPASGSSLTTHLPYPMSILSPLPTRPGVSLPHFLRTRPGQAGGNGMEECGKKSRVRCRNTSFSASPRPGNLRRSIRGETGSEERTPACYCT